MIFIEGRLYTFQEAIEALDKGKVIQRVSSELKYFKSLFALKPMNIIEICPTDDWKYAKYCEMEYLMFSYKDVIALDWMIFDKKKVE